MEANKLGFTAASYPCEFGLCSRYSRGQLYTDANEFGPGPDHEIDSSLPFKVITKFFAEEEDGNLVKIETTLKQGDRYITLI